MGIFSNLNTAGHEATEDRVGGGGGFVRDTGIYLLTIKAAYAGKSNSSNAQSVSFIFEDDAGKEYRETFWVTDGEGKNYFHPKDKSGNRDTTKRNSLPGFSLVNDICIIATDKPLGEQQDEEKVIKLYDFEAKAELPKAVPMLTELLGKQVALAIYKVLENKSEKSEATGKYEDIAETREKNESEKALFPKYRCTVREAEVAMANNGTVDGDAIVDQQGNNVGVFWEQWETSHAGKVKDKRSIKDGDAGKTGRPGAAPRTAAPVAGAAGGERKRLFS